MAEKLDSKEMVSFEALLMSNILTQEAIVNHPIQNGIFTKEDIIREIGRLKQAPPETE